ncbi:ribosomal protein S18-alanine N-acetyltransferase [Enterococcus sp. LJL98]
MWKKYNFLRFSFFKYRKKQYKERQFIHQGQVFFVRELTYSDVKALLDVQRLTYEGQTPWNRSGFLSELYSRYTHLYLGVLSEEKMIGFMGVRVFLEDGHITNIAIVPSFQGKGIGSFLMAEAESFSRSQTCQTMSLEVRMGNTDAQRFYRRLGFVSRKVLPNYYDENQEDGLDMVKYL